MDLTYKIVRRLFRDDDVNFSRNKNFEAYDDPMVRRAVRLYHHLESVERDLLSLASGGSASLEGVERRDDRMVVRLKFHDEEARRVSFLSMTDWRLLLENPEVRSILDELIAETDSQTQNVLRETLPDNPPGGDPRETELPDELLDRNNA
jgi:hypothetical protein